MSTTRGLLIWSTYTRSYQRAVGGRRRRSHATSQYQRLGSSSTSHTSLATHVYRIILRIYRVLLNFPR
ncbi:unnamed protein product [Lathyrus oleraceus]